MSMLLLVWGLVQHTAHYVMKMKKPWPHGLLPAGGILSENITINSCQDFLKFIRNPLLVTNAPKYDKSLTLHPSIQFVVTIECIWNLRNQVIHSDMKVNIIATVKTL